MFASPVAFEIVARRATMIACGNLDTSAQVLAFAAGTSHGFNLAANKYTKNGVGDVTVSLSPDLNTACFVTVSFLTVGVFSWSYSKPATDTLRIVMLDAAGNAKDATIQIAVWRPPYVV